MSKKILSMLLVAVMLATVALTTASCGKTDDTSSTDSNASDGAVVYTDPYADLEGDEKYAAIYDDVLGEFSEAYEAAKAETNVSKKWALMAIAEAKLMESALMLPLTSNGGLYAISRVAPYTVDYTLWGNDNYRYHQALVADKFITAEHRAEMKAKWVEVKGQGTYEAWAKQYLADKGYTLKDSYSIGYSSDPQTWDVLATSRAADSEAIINTYDGLYEYDIEGTLKPALAESYTVETTGEGEEMRTVYTFKIREGVEWVDYQGRKVADLTAKDFVTGMQHMMDAAEGLEYLVQGVVVNATEYIGGDITDFSQVGVKAVDDYTLEYTLIGNPTYFMTMLGYGVFAPMSESYYKSQGGQFGEEYDNTVESYKYGTSPENIAYCGPYCVTNLTEKNTIVFSANESYWNKDNINIKTLTWKFNDGEDALKAYNDAVAGTIDGCSLNPSALELCKTEGNFDDYAYVSSTDATTFSAFYNVNREAFKNVADETKVVSSQTEEIATRTAAALRNVHFRRAISFALDRGAYNAMTNGEEVKLYALRNTYTPGTFVALEEDVTVSINGTDTEYKAGTYYGKIMQDQINADGVKIKVWDPEAEEGLGSSDGFDGWYNAENAVEEMNTAITELAAIGIEISAENPIQLDLPYFSGSESYGNRANAYKQSLETVLGNKVQVNLVECSDSADWYYAGYYTNYGKEANYDLYDVSGWGPDYGDPQTYLDTFLPEYQGYMLKCIGIY